MIVGVTHPSSLLDTRGSVPSPVKDRVGKEDSLEDVSDGSTDKKKEVLT